MSVGLCVVGAVHFHTLILLLLSWDRILERNWDKSLKSFPPCYSQSPLLTDPPPPPPWATVVWNNIVYRNIKSENYQDYAQKPQRNCTFMNSASVLKQTAECFTCSTLQCVLPICKLDRKQILGDQCIFLLRSVFGHILWILFDIFPSKIQYQYCL